MDRLLYRLGRACVRKRWLVLVIWVVALIGITVVGKAGGGHYRDDFSVNGVGSQTAADLLQSKFPAAGGASAQVVVHAREGTLVTPPNIAAIAAMEKQLAALPGAD